MKKSKTKEDILIEKLDHIIQILYEIKNMPHMPSPGTGYSIPIPQMNQCSTCRQYYYLGQHVCYGNAVHPC